ncbi:MAG: hypothetical protein DMG76_04765 [Acidobacteria bacterium]|nr:MAG: hypothetical protein DMG76_04765 [Acidobacteriota bacterium]
MRGSKVGYSMVLRRRGGKSLEILNVVVFSKIHRDWGHWGRKVGLFYFFRLSPGLAEPKLPSTAHAVGCFLRLHRLQVRGVS